MAYALGCKGPLRLHDVEGLRLRGLGFWDEGMCRV